jgi:DegV family protein with EDD domain
MATKIVTDSSADLPPDLARRWDITVIPCNIVVDDVSYKDGVDLSPDEFYRHLGASPRLPTTAQPSMADFQEVYQSLLTQGHHIVSIHVSGKLSGTLNSAERARASLGNSVSIEIIDSQLASIGLGLAVLAAAQLAQGGVTYREVAEQVRRDLPQTHAFFLLDTLEYLQKGGRIGKAQAFVGSMLSVKPILKIIDGEAHGLERPRNRQRALLRLVELVRGLSPVRQLGVIYSTEPDQADELRQKLADLLPEDQIVTSRFGPVVGTYLGPKALGVALTSAVSRDP